jgi:hypothetical protein
MQLRVARLCLDCEELHMDDSCPRCASESYAFLAKWLPSEERRRWRRPSGRGQNEGRGVVRAIGRWFKGEPAAAPASPTTRVSDHVAALGFEEVEKRRTTAPIGPELSKNQTK